MVAPKFANPHSLSLEVERTTRLEIAQRAGLTSIAHDEVHRSLKHDLDTLLQDTWADAFAEASNLSRRAKKHRDIADNDDDQLAFRLLSSMKRPQRISLSAKPPPAPVSREPDCEDDKAQAETRKKRALSVAVEIDDIGEAAVSARKTDHKPAIVGVKVPITESLPPLLVTEKARARKATWPANVNARDPESSVPSPHEPRMSCTVLPVTSVPNRREMPWKNRRKSVRERPSPAYWRPSPALRGKCLGYALGYPSSWAPDRRYVRDTMKKGVHSTCHAVHDDE